MRRAGLVAIAVLSVILAALLIFEETAGTEARAGLGTTTVISAPEQSRALKSKEFAQEEYVAPVIEGTNVALGACATANGFNDVYKAGNVVDGARATYWEGSPNMTEDILTVDLGDTHKVYTVVLALNPAAIWSKRTQTLSLETSVDGETYTESVSKKKYEFDPKTGNQIVIEFEETEARYVRAVITANTGAVGGQVAEFEVYER